MMETKAYPRYAIFDMDGTLLDSMHYWRGARRETFRALGIEPSAATLEAPLAELSEVLLREHRLRMTDEELRRAIFDTVLSHYRADVTPYRNVLRELFGIVRAGGRAVLLTATPHPYCDEALRIFGLTNSFAAVLAPDGKRSLSKRDPESFRLALEALGCDDPHACRVYEDALYSIRTAKAMGFPVTAVLDPSAEKDRREILSLADDVIDPIKGEAGERFPYRAALFDMDGTLLDSMQGLTESYQTVLNAALPSEYQREVDFFVPFACYEADEALRRISEALGLPLDTERLKRELMQEVERRYRTLVRPYPEMLERLRALKNDGVALGIITATPHPQCDIAVEATGLSEYISLILTPADNGGVGKRDPSIFRLALGRLGCDDPSRGAMYEDAVYSLGTARSLGMYCVAVLDRMAKATFPELSEIADEVIRPTPVSRDGSAR